MTRPRQHNLELSKKSGLRIDIYAAAVLLDDDVVAHRQAKPGTLTSSLAHLRENFAAVELKLPASAMKELDDVETAKAE